MGRKLAITAQEIARSGAAQVISKNVKQATVGDAVAREIAAVALRGLAIQNHGEYAAALVAAGAISPLVKLLAGSTSNAKAQEPAAQALCALASSKQAHQQLIIDVGGLSALVHLLRFGSPKGKAKDGTMP